MGGRTEIVVTLDGRVLDGRRPLLRADDPMFARGDGAFETLLVRDGRICLLDAHLRRLECSAEILGLPAPDPERWRAAATRAVGRWPHSRDAVLRLVYGRERGGGTTGFAIVSALPARVLAARRDGLSAMTLDRGVTADGADQAPWSCSAAKSLSYATNTAALRHAERLGHGDVIFTSTDGFILEGPRSSVVIADGSGMLLTSPTASPILAGTTVRAVFDVARARGRVCEDRPLRIGDLLAAQGVWLLSSITLAARVHTLDGVRLPGDSAGGDVLALVVEAISRHD